ncbi:hypothetical protein VWS36_004306 [Cronobacter sakazakii]|uniref:gp53-like domain-containing protein n=1 Tax=Cronobacter sakazakii TaxID=28141 RepID=UPI0010556F00|nr:hypothetical protein [Cronobacter sakazakii]ELY2811997.1 hypothetical protein [Cronobacter sakazakii]EMC4130063.1 hypothetical protein [Cronobacter sakazakii]EMD7587820.1 hypothetical protein [Cronobacter sakazakii]EME1796595.1 hypothetical protein [Cronobacter sakazakii]EME1927596.1 hypothetical protein [Cronobacter sakazakii]
MNSSDSPSRVLKAFGINGLKNNVPVDSSSSTDNNGIATFDKGFPPITMQPKSAGGIPPSGKDMNGVLYAVTLQQQWQNAGMTYAFNQDFANQINGYPKGAMLPNSTSSGVWMSLSDNNLTSPEPVASASWVPFNSYGYTSLSGITTSTITLTAMQASKERITLSGAITSNINLILPGWLKSWTIVNNCTGSFSVICKTQSGTGVTIANGSTAKVYGDGVNILTEFGSAAYRDVGNGTNQIPDMSLFQSGIGWTKFPDGTIIQRGTTISGNRGFPALVTLPIPFTSSFTVATSFDQAITTAKDCPSFAVTPAGLTAFYLMSSRTSGTGAGANWIAIGK